MLAAILYPFYLGDRAVADRLGRLTISGKSITRVGLALVGVILVMGSARALPPLSRPGAPVVQVVVRPGDTLWTYAQKYGDPDRYILARVEEIARINHLTGSQPLQPGQTVIIPLGK